MRRAYIPTDDRRDRRKGRFIAFLIHAGLIFLAVWPFLQTLPEERTAEIQVVMVDFRQETSGSQREGASASAKSGEESTREEETQPEEVIEEPVEEVQEEEITEPQPEVVEATPINPTPQPELITTTAPEPVSLPPVPPSPPQPEPEIVPEPEIIPEPTVSKPTPPAPPREPEPEPQPQPEKPKSAIEQIRDFFSKPENNPRRGRNGNDGDGTGDNSSGDEKNDGKAESGNNGSGDEGDGSSDSGNRADGSGTGFIEGMGKLSRQILSKPSIADLIKKEGTIVVKVCINRRGTVIYTEFDKENSTIQDAEHRKRAVDHVQKVIFKANNAAPDRECGRLYYSLTKQGFEEGQ